jgi:hypothetical protein
MARNKMTTSHSTKDNRIELLCFEGDICVMEFILDNQEQANTLSADFLDGKLNKVTEG